VDESDLDINVPAPSMQISFRVSDFLVSAEDSAGSAIVRLRIDSIRSVPKAVTAATLHWDEKVHPWDYGIAVRFPGGRVVQLGVGSFVFDEPYQLRWDGSVRLFLPAGAVREILKEGSAIELEVWRDLNEDFQGFGLTDTAVALTTARGELSSSDFTKPGQSRFVGEVALITREPGRESIRIPDSAKVEDEVETKKVGGKLVVVKKTPARASTVRKKPKRVASAKDKKQVKVVQTALAELTDADGFDGKQLLSIDMAFDHSLVVKPLVPKATRRPLDIVGERTKVTGAGHHLGGASAEFRTVIHDIGSEIAVAQKVRQERQLRDPSYPEGLQHILDASTSWVTSQERLKNAMTEVFRELCVARAASTEEEMVTLRQALLVYLQEQVQQEYTDIFPDAKQKGDERPFLIAQSEEAESCGQPVMAAAFLEEVLALDLHDAESWWLYAHLQLKHNDIGRAEECLRRGLTCDPEHVNLGLGFASMLARQQRFHDAIAFLKPLPAADEFLGKVALDILHSLANLPNPDQPLKLSDEELVSTALAFLDLGDVVFSEQLIAQLQMRNGETAEVLFLFGKLFHQLGDRAKAASFLKRSIDLDHSGKALIELGDVDFERERWSSAVSLYTVGIEKTPNLAASSRLGQAFLALGRAKEAEAVLATCSPQSANTLLNLALAAIGLGKLRQADELLARASVVNPRDPRIWITMGELMAKLGRPEDAEYCEVRAAGVKTAVSAVVSAGGSRAALGALAVEETPAPAAAAAAPEPAAPAPASKPALLGGMLQGATGVISAAVAAPE
jgi:tetratricopeptide (TPR) repeat protein